MIIVFIYKSVIKMNSLTSIINANPAILIQTVDAPEKKKIKVITKEAKKKELTLKFLSELIKKLNWPKEYDSQCISHAVKFHICDIKDQIQSMGAVNQLADVLFFRLTYNIGIKISDGIFSSFIETLTKDCNITFLSKPVLQEKIGLIKSELKILGKISKCLSELDVDDDDVTYYNAKVLDLKKSTESVRFGKKDISKEHFLKCADLIVKSICASMEQLQILNNPTFRSLFPGKEISFDKYSVRIQEVLKTCKEKVNSCEKVIEMIKNPKPLQMGILIEIRKLNGQLINIDMQLESLFDFISKIIDSITPCFNQSQIDDLNKEIFYYRFYNNPYSYYTDESGATLNSIQIVLGSKIDYKKPYTILMKIFLHLHNLMDSFEKFSFLEISGMTTTNKIISNKSYSSLLKELESEERIEEPEDTTIIEEDKEPLLDIDAKEATKEAETSPLKYTIIRDYEAKPINESLQAATNFAFYAAMKELPITVSNVQIDTRRHEYLMSFAKMAAEDAKYHMGVLASSIELMSDSQDAPIYGIARSSGLSCEQILTKKIYSNGNDNDNHHHLSLGRQLNIDQKGMRFLKTLNYASVFTRFPISSRKFLNETSGVPETLTWIINPNNITAEKVKKHVIETTIFFEKHLPTTAISLKNVFNQKLDKGISISKSGSNAISEALKKELTAPLKSISNLIAKVKERMATYTSELSRTQTNDQVRISLLNDKIILWEEALIHLRWLEKEINSFSKHPETKYLLAHGENIITHLFSLYEGVKRTFYFEETGNFFITHDLEDLDAELEQTVTNENHAKAVKAINMGYGLQYPNKKHFFLNRDGKLSKQAVIIPEALQWKLDAYQASLFADELDAGSSVIIQKTTFDEKKVKTLRSRLVFYIVNIVEIIENSMNVPLQTPVFTRDVKA